MYTKKLLFLFSACSALLLGSCTKEETPTPGTNTTQNPPVTASLLCDGSKNTTHYFPLKMGNSWVVEGGATKTVSRDTILSGKKYFILTTKTASGQTTDSYFRSEPKGDIYEYKLYNTGGENPYSKEYLYLPYDAETIVGYEWDFPGATTATDGKMIRRKISSSNGSVNTSKCNYTGLLVMHDYDANGQMLATYYFKRGLGKVRETISTTNSDLGAVVIKN